MAEAALLGLAFASSYLGFALFALSQKVHHASVARSAGPDALSSAARPRALPRAASSRAASSRAALPSPARQRCIAFGTGGLAASLAASLTAEGASFGSILWVLALAAAALSVTFTLSYRPHWLRTLQRAVARA